jgi:DNA-binding transcriptional LysR family regulator
VAAGIGVTLVPAIPGVPSRPGVELRPVPEIDEGIGVFVAHAKNPSPAAAAFLREVAEEMASMPHRYRTGT